jgi:hypothetical protein
MLITSIFALRVEMIDQHIKSEEIRNDYIILRGFEITTSGLTLLSYFFKKYKLAIFFGIFFIAIIVLNS